MRMSLVRIRSCWIKVDPKFDRSGVFTRKDTLARAQKGRWPCKDTGRTWSDAEASQGTPRIAGHHPKLGRARRDASLELLEHGPVDSSFPPSGLHNCERIHFCGLRPPPPPARWWRFVPATAGHIYMLGVTRESVPHGFLFVNGFYIQSVGGEGTSSTRSATQQVFIQCRAHVREHPRSPQFCR